MSKAVALKEMVINPNEMLPEVDTSSIQDKYVFPVGVKFKKPAIKLAIFNKYKILNPSWREIYHSDGTPQFAQVDINLYDQKELVGSEGRGYPREWQSEKTLNYLLSAIISGALGLSFLIAFALQAVIGMHVGGLPILVGVVAVSVSCYLGFKSYRTRHTSILYSKIVPPIPKSACTKARQFIEELKQHKLSSSDTYMVFEVPKGGWNKPKLADPVLVVKVQDTEYVVDQWDYSEAELEHLKYAYRNSL